MRIALVLLFALVAAALIAIGLRIDTGYVELSYHGYTAEMTLVSFSAFLFAGMIVLYAALRGTIWLIRLPARMRRLLRRRRRLRARRNLTRGLIDLAEGRWSESEKRLSRSAGDGETPLIHYLGAARAAQLQSAHERRDQYLREAYESTPQATVAVLLTQAELQIAHGQHEQAQATLRRLQELKPGHAYGLKLLARLEASMGDWNRVESLLPQLRKSPLMRPETVEDLETKVLRERLREASTPGNGDELKSLWRSFPRRLRQRAELIRLMAQALLDAGDNEAAETLIRDSLRAEWDDELARLYGLAISENSQKQLARVEKWLEDHSDSAGLLLTAGRLCAANGLWGKARAYLQSSLNLAPRSEAYAELGKLFARTDRPRLAMEAFRQGLDFSLSGRADPAALKALDQSAKSERPARDKAAS